MPRRDEEQCNFCCCFLKNLDKKSEAYRRLMSHGDGECTQDQYPYTNKKCYSFCRMDKKKE